nr:unnamed protein product [Callosobruchus analis]
MSVSVPVSVLRPNTFTPHLQQLGLEGRLHKTFQNSVILKTCTILPKFRTVIVQVSTWRSPGRSKYIRVRSDVEQVKNLASQYTVSQIFTLEESKALVKYLIDCSSMNYGLTRRSAMISAVEFATTKSKQTTKSWATNYSTTKDGLRDFMARNPVICVGTVITAPTSTSNAKCTSQKAVA